MNLLRDAVIPFSAFNVSSQNRPDKRSVEVAVELLPEESLTVFSSVLRDIPLEFFSEDLRFDVLGFINCQPLSKSRRVFPGSFVGRQPVVSATGGVDKKLDRKSTHLNY